MSDITKTHATGQIEVKTYDARPYDEVGDGPAVVEIHTRETFSGDIEGEGVVRFLQAVRDDRSVDFELIELRPFVAFAELFATRETP